MPVEAKLVSEVFLGQKNEWEVHGENQRDMFEGHAASVKGVGHLDRIGSFCYNDFLIPEAIMLLDVSRDLLEMLEEESFRRDSAASIIVIPYMCYLHTALSLSLYLVLYTSTSTSIYIYALIEYTYSVSKHVDMNKILQTLTFADLPIWSR